MIVEDRIDAIRKWTLDQRRHGASIGLVPTMGALHEGHISLVRASRSQCQKTVATIFVNPAQFAAGEDLDRYPRTLDADLEKLDAAGVDAVFTPTSVSMYPKGFSTYVDTPRVARTLEGLDRPTHFRGVTTVVLKLFNIIPATHAFFGQKDYQQAAVIRAMVRDLDVGIDIEVCPIVRETDGLAMSSRNRYLSPEQRQRALSLSQALVRAKELFAGGCRDAVGPGHRCWQRRGGDLPEYGFCRAVRSCAGVGRVPSRPRCRRCADKRCGLARRCQCRRPVPARAIPSGACCPSRTYRSADRQPDDTGAVLPRAASVR